jgi:hypothetical protein
MRLECPQFLFLENKGRLTHSFDVSNSASATQSLKSDPFEKLAGADNVECRRTLPEESLACYLSR